MLEEAHHEPNKQELSTSEDPRCAPYPTTPAVVLSSLNVQNQHSREAHAAICKSPAAFVSALQNALGARLNEAVDRQTKVIETASQAIDTIINRPLQVLSKRTEALSAQIGDELSRRESVFELFGRAARDVKLLSRGRATRSRRKLNRRIQSAQILAKVGTEKLRNLLAHVRAELMLWRPFEIALWILNFLAPSIAELFERPPPQPLPLRIIPKAAPNAPGLTA